MMEEPWPDILKGSYHKKLYCLNIINEIFSSNLAHLHHW